MALGERFRSGGARGIARFLSDHQQCDVGFDVRREAGAGTGVLSITCKGCGGSISYKAAEAGELAAGPQIADNASAIPPTAPSKPKVAKAPKAERPERAPRRPRRPRDRGLKALIPKILIVTLILAGLVLIAIGVVRSGGESEPGTPTATTPTEPTVPAEAPPAEPPPAAPAEQQAQTAPSAQEASEVQLKRREFEGRFAIGVPVGWRTGTAGTAINIASGDDLAGIRVFLESGAEPVGQLARGATGFLADEHDGAEIGKPQPQRLGQQKALTVTAAYDGGEETATVLTRGGYAYLILRRVDVGASPQAAADADAALRSFRAKA